MPSLLPCGESRLWFVTIHPFEDGNGRIARGLADMMLARGDGSRDRFYSMSTQIEGEKKEYYRTLELSQRGDLDITRWMAWFLGCLDRAVRDISDLVRRGILHKNRAGGRSTSYRLVEK